LKEENEYNIGDLGKYFRIFTDFKTGPSPGFRSRGDHIF